MADATGEVTDLFGGAVPEPSEAERIKAVAQAVTVDVFSMRHPRPAQKFVAVLGVARALLTAGHAPEAVTAAMVEDGALTIAAVEHRLGKARERERASGPSPRQRRKAEATAAFVGDEQPTGRVGAAFFGAGQRAVGS